MWEAEILCSEEFQDLPVGYFTCWWAQVWTPTVHTVRTIVLVKNPVLLSPSMSALFLTAGLFCIWRRYDANRRCHDQRVAARRGREYTTEPGGTSELQLELCDLIVAMLWSAPGVDFTTQCVVLVYPVSLALRLILSRSMFPNSSK
mmetsp:Transcript_8229/g.15519  ORF Transcript_8229/g.15519 Transcript_8229/m.15519 type:complete len:146 (+) Transcript_8229:700-1137(+)